MNDLDATHYRQNSFIQYSLAQEVLKSISLKENETILDIGCAEGRMTAEIAKCVPKGAVIGIDLSPAMISLARSSFPIQDYPNLSFRQGAAEEVTIEPPVDSILVMNTFHWIRHPSKALRHFNASLKPGGRLFMLTYPKDSPFWNFLVEELQEDRWKSVVEQSAHKTLLTVVEYKQLIENQGFVIEESFLEEKVALYASTAQLIAYIKGWLNCYLPLPSDLEDVFLCGAAEKARRYSLVKGSEEIHLPFLKWVLKARKASAG